MSNSNRSTAPSRAGLDRRRFVALASTAAAAQWLTGVDRLSSAGLPSSPEGPALVPGYLRGSSVLVRDDLQPSVLRRSGTPFFEGVRAAIDPELPLELVSSLDLDHLPPLAGTSALVEVHGLLPPDQVRADNAIRSIELLVEIASSEQPSPTPFITWSYERQPVEQLAGPSQFTVPLGPDVVLRLALRLTRVEARVRADGRDGGRERSDAWRPALYIIDLPAEDRWGQPRLRQGVYAIPLSFEAERSLPLPANRDWLVPLDLQFLMFSVHAARA
jgi:hypothetical protein